MISARLVLSLLAVAALAGCSRGSTSNNMTATNTAVTNTTTTDTTTTNTASSSGSFAEQQTAYLSTLTPAQGWQSTASGIRYRKISGPGTGAKPSATDTVTLHYVGTLTDGTEFDSSRKGPNQPVTFPLQDLIPGWQEGVPLMGTGDTYEFAIPADLAYGPRGSGPIPGGATLLFTIELIAIVR